jgi:hypothetical protein
MAHNHEWHTPRLVMHYRKSATRADGVTVKYYTLSREEYRAYVGKFGSHGRHGGQVS